MKPPTTAQEFLDRLADLGEAHAIMVQIGFLRKAAELAPAAASALAAREAELRAERLAIDPPVILCPDCGYEWAGRRRPRLRCSYRGGNHDWIVNAWEDVLESGLRRGSKELPEDFRARMAAWFRDDGSIWRDEIEKELDDRPQVVEHA